MAPYVKFIVGDQTQKSSTIKKRTTDFFWEDNNEVSFDYLGNEFINIEVWSNKKLLKDKLIGSGSFSLDSFLARNSTMESIPLFFEGMDAGTLQLGVYFTPSNANYNAGGLGSNLTTNTLTTSNTYVEQPIAQQSVIQQPVIQQPVLEQQTVVQENLTYISKPVITSDVKVIKHEPIYTQETPIVYEKNIIHEKPIITEKTIVYSEQPIIIERPELHERVVNEQLAPVLQTEQTIVRQEEGLAGGVNLQGAIVHSETQHIQDQAQFYRETPIIHQKDVILEKPVIHEKDIIYREKPVIVEKPEIVEKHIYETQAPITQVYDTVFTKEKEFSTTRPLVGDDAVYVKEDAILNVAEPTFMKEMPDVHETQVIHEKRLITEKPIVHTEKEVIYEKPEVHEKRIFHQEPTLLQKEQPVYFQDTEVLQKEQPLLNERTGYFQKQEPLIGQRTGLDQPHA
jgi:hypothetical protein